MFFFFLNNIYIYGDGVRERESIWRWSERESIWRWSEREREIYIYIYFVAWLIHYAIPIDFRHYHVRGLEILDGFSPTSSRAALDPPFQRQPFFGGRWGITNSTADVGCCS